MFPLKISLMKDVLGSPAAVGDSDVGANVGDAVGAVGANVGALVGAVGDMLGAYVGALVGAVGASVAVRNAQILNAVEPPVEHQRFPHVACATKDHVEPNPTLTPSGPPLPRPYE